VTHSKLHFYVDDEYETNDGHYVIFIYDEDKVLKNIYINRDAVRGFLDMVY
jgi:putative heme iron utilization protein